MKTFTIEEIKTYLLGNIILGNTLEWNYSLQNAITLLEDYEDGIEAVIERINKRNHDERFND